MIRADEAQGIITGSVSPGASEVCKIADCLGRVLAADIPAPRDLPLFDNSSMDGFALRTGDITSATRESPVHLKLSGELPAGTWTHETLRPGHAMRIMTGAPIPPGADAVAEQELTESDNGSVRIFSTFAAGRNIRKRGESLSAGALALRKGLRLSPAAVGSLASMGISQVEVYRRPTVALVCTGSEVVDLDHTPSPGQIWNSNAFTLRGALQNCGMEVVDLGIVADSKEQLTDRIREALACDAVVTSGGVSVGKYDLVLEVLKSLGVEIEFWKLNIKPGMPMAFGVSKGKARHVPVFALPGNPVSAMVTFDQFVRPGLEKLSGIESPERRLRIKATLEEPIQKKDGKRHFIRGIARNAGGGIVVTTTGTQSSGVLMSLVKANCLIILSEESGSLNKGDVVEIELL
ncbi:MAG: gephyrin-like molybdotransferase Glp [Bacteroidota bacterium]